MKGLVYEGFTDEYKTDLAVSFFYKAIVNALVQRKVKIPANVKSSGEITWGRWAVSDGTQHYETEGVTKTTDPNFQSSRCRAVYQTDGVVSGIRSGSLHARDTSAAERSECGYCSKPPCARRLLF